MTKLEHFKAWAGINHPAAPQDGGERAGKFYFYDQFLQFAWRAFNHAFTVRPTTTMENGKLDKEKFMQDDPATIVDRLNGIFPTADPPYKMTPLHYEAAREIERLRGLIAEIERMVKLNAPDDYADIAGQLSEILNKKPAEAG